MFKLEEYKYLSPMQRYEIRFSTTKPKKNFILKCRSSSRLELMSDKAVKNILQDWINRTFETPYKVKQVLYVGRYFEDSNKISYQTYWREY